MGIYAMDFALKFNQSIFSTPYPPKPSPKCRFLTARCSLPLSSDGAATGLAERPWKVADARLLLEDGSIWRAKSFGASGTRVGEVVFNTSLTGTSNWRCVETLGDYLAERNVMGIYDVDTRAITCRLRQDGSLIGVLSTEQSRSDDELLEMSRSWDIVGIDLISGVTCNAPYEWVDETKSEWDFNSDGRDRDTYRNHNYAVDPASLPEGVEVTHVNLNDGSCAGLAYPALSIMSLQYHPEASPGPHDSDCAFREFIELMESTKQAA
ncbi:hypothetical protein GOBAR_DD18653 [Gossypium barbadense]|nr:hypothetical protein GOBAR_DD18653 [Gossypium barbadense]